MMRIISRKWTIAAAAFLIAPGVPAYAEITLSASVDKQNISIDDSIALTVTVSGDTSNVPEPKLPSLPSFNVYPAGQGQNISLINGRISSSIIYNFTLVPRMAGPAVIGSVTINYDGKVYSTPEMGIMVTNGRNRQPASAPQQAQTSVTQPRLRNPQAAPHAANTANPVFVTARLDKKEAYVNEQITLSVRFYYSAPLMGDPIYLPPETKNFIAEDLPPPRTGSETVEGRIYNFTELKIALFAAAPGTASLGPATFRYQVRDDVELDPFAPNFFQRLMSNNAGTPKELRTPPLFVSIKPLPEDGRPDSFNGAVGRYKVTASIDRRELRAGEAANLSIAVEGAGNIKTIPAPQLPDLDFARTYDTTSSASAKPAGDVLQGVKTFKTVMIPKASGSYIIPAIPFSFFNPALKSYDTAQTQPLKLNVLPGQAAPGAQVSFATQENNGIQSLGEDIHYIAETDERRPLTDALTAIEKAGLVNFVPLLVFIAAFIVRRVVMAEEDPAVSRYKKAFLRAKEAVSRAESQFSSGNAGEAIDILSEALNDYLCAKLACPIGSLTLKQMSELVSSTFPSATPKTVSKLESIWQELELLRFAPNNPSASDTQHQHPISVRVNELIAELEKEFKK